MKRIIVHNHLPARDALPTNSTGKSASDWSRIMGDLRERKPRPVKQALEQPGERASRAGCGGRAKDTRVEPGIQLRQ